MKKKTQEHGFVALITVLITAAILLMFVFTVGLAGFFSRFDALGTENKRVSLGLAEACINTALLHIAQNPTTYAGNELIIVENTTPIKRCKICAFTAAALPYTQTLTLRASYGGSYTNLQISVNAAANGVVTLSSWAESASNPTPACTLP